MSIFLWIAFIIYLLFQTVLLFYAITEFVLMIRFVRSKKLTAPEPPNEWPLITVQLPLYNEANVVERLIDCIIELDYPPDKLEIQLLDDSTDETTDIIRNKLTNLSSQFTIEHIRRVRREGFKAGALDYGLKRSKGEFIAIFDADFLPPSDFLKQAIPYFSNESIGVVQTRWGHINENYSLLTRIQAIFLNTHFSVEQLGRNESGAYINFNGTAGIWRKTCIESGGGWQADTLTEDLDLSFRAQMKGWKFKYLFDQESPAELPTTLQAFKVQQFRWSKGAAECTRKNIVALFRLKDLSLGSKIISAFHLMNSSAYIVIFGFMLLSLPLAIFFEKFGNYSDLFGVLVLTYITSVLLFAVFLAGNVKISKHKLRTVVSFPFLFPLFLMTSMGISLYLMIGVVEGYMGKKSDFIRTPKLNIRSDASSKTSVNYKSLALTPIMILELVLLGYCLISIFYTWQFENYPLVIYESMFTLGLTVNISSGLYHMIRS